MATYDNKLVDGKGLDQLSKGLYQKLKTEIDAKPNTTVEGGKGLTVAKSGDSYTLNVVSQDDGIIVNEDNIKLNTVNVLTDTSAVKPLSANMGKKLNDDKLDKSTFNTEKTALQNSINTKLDKGAYAGNAQDLKNEINSKQNIIDNSLKTKDKKVIGAINELFNDRWRHYGHPIEASASVPFDLNNLKELGYWYSRGYVISKYILNRPYSEEEPFFILNYSMLGVGNLFLNQILITYESNRMFIRSFIAEKDEKLQWSAWCQVYTTSSVQSWKSEDGAQGWVKYPDGRLEQWGCNGAYQRQDTTINLLLAFSNNQYAVLISTYAADTPDHYRVNGNVSSASNQKFTVHLVNIRTTENEVYKFFWHAIGWWK